MIVFLVTAFLHKKQNSPLSEFLTKLKLLLAPFVLSAFAASSFVSLL
jgi:hypothetical protein